MHRKKIEGHWISFICGGTPLGCYSMEILIDDVCILETVSMSVACVCDCVGAVCSLFISLLFGPVQPASTPFFSTTTPPMKRVSYFARLFRFFRCFRNFQDDFVCLFSASVYVNMCVCVCVRVCLHSVPACG